MDSCSGQQGKEIGKPRRSAPRNFNKLMDHPGKNEFRTATWIPNSVAFSLPMASCAAFLGVEFSAWGMDDARLPDFQNYYFFNYACPIQVCSVFS